MLPTAQPKPLSRAAEKLDARKLKEAYRRVVYRLVSKRDKHQCRACHRKGPGLHHHHLRFRSRAHDETERNVLLLCPICHADLHGYRLFIEGDDANGVLGFTRQR